MSVCQRLSRLLDFVKFGVPAVCIKRRLFCAYRLNDSRPSAVCLSGCHIYCSVAVQLVTRDPRAILFTIDGFRENGRSGSGALLTGTLISVP